MVGAGAGCCSSRQCDVLVFPSSMGWCLMQARPTPLCLSTSGIQTKRMTLVWSARPCPVMSRVSIPLPWAWCCPSCSCGGWDDLALPFVGLPMLGSSVHQAATAGTVGSPGCRVVPDSSLASLMVGGFSAPRSVHTLGGTEAPWSCSGFSFLHLGLPLAAQAAVLAGEDLIHRAGDTAESTGDVGKP